VLLKLISCIASSVSIFARLNGEIARSQGTFRQKYTTPNVVARPWVVVISHSSRSSAGKRKPIGKDDLEQQVRESISSF
jgi:hypothetical protein